MPFFFIWKHSEIQGSLTYRLDGTAAKAKKGKRLEKGSCRSSEVAVFDRNNFCDIKNISGSFTL